MNSFEKVVSAVMVIFLLSLSGFLGFALGRQNMVEQSSVQVETVKCTRCGSTCDKASMVVYAVDGKTDILLCKKCVYAQAESFLKFCPMEE